MAIWSVLVGRFLLGLYFFIPGLMKVAAPADTLVYMQSHGILFALPFLWIAAASNIIGGVLLMTGRYVKWVAYGFVIYIVLVNLLLHDFWAMPGDSVERETQNFIKNLGILAGLLVLAGNAHARRLSLAEFWQSDAAVARKTKF